jgi:hypothetical protein
LSRKKSKIRAGINKALFGRRNYEKERSRHFWRRCCFVCPFQPARLQIDARKRLAGGLLSRHLLERHLDDGLHGVSIDAASWEIVSVSEEKIEPAQLVELGKAEMESKKKLEEHVGPVMDAEDALYGAQEELKAARTGASRAAAKKKVDEMQAKFDEERELHKELQRSYNEAKDAAQKEKDIATFSVIGPTGDLPNVMDLTGTVHSKDVDVKITNKAGEEVLYRFNLKRYELRDEAANLNHRGRWIIVKFGPAA